LHSLCTMTHRLCIIADDFTGAGDAAIQFRKTGASVVLALKGWSAGSDFGSCNVLVVNSESRFLDEEKSYATVRDIVLKCPVGRSGRIFKKIDSTIRGNVAAEIQAVLDSSDYRCALVAPAAPRNGRTVVGGRCLVRGVPISDSNTGRDPFNPVRNSSVPELFERRFPGKVASIDLGVVRCGGPTFRARFSSLVEAGARIVVCDAETIDDLRTAASMQDDPAVLFAGASGLAEALTAESQAKIPPGPPVSVEAGRVLFVVGSVTETSRVQTERLLASSDVVPVRISIPDLLGNPGKEFSRLVEEAKNASRSLPVLIRTFESAEDIRNDLAFAQSRGCHEKELGERIASFLGGLVRARLAERHARALFVTGGNTAAGVAEALDIKGIELLDEVSPGIPLGRFTSPYADEPIYIVSKSGGFGDEDAMPDVLRYLTGRRGGSASSKIEQRSNHST